MAKFVILHDLVGVHFKGELVEIGKEAEKIGVDIERLLHIGAIRKATSDDKGEVATFGEGQTDIPKPFPAVPFENVAAPVPAGTTEAPAEEPKK